MPGHVVLEQFADLADGEAGPVDGEQGDADADQGAAGGKGEGKGDGAQGREDERTGELGAGRDGVGRAEVRLLEVARPGEDRPEDVEADKNGGGGAEAVDCHGESVHAGDGARRPPYGLTGVASGWVRASSPRRPGVVLSDDARR